MDEGIFGLIVIVAMTALFIFGLSLGVGVGKNIIYEDFAFEKCIVNTESHEVFCWDDETLKMEPVFGKD